MYLTDKPIVVGEAYRRVSPQGGEAVVINRTQRQRSEAVAVAPNCGSNGRIITIITNNYLGERSEAVVLLLYYDGCTTK
jgi:hypothetical protein